MIRLAPHKSPLPSRAELTAGKEGRYPWSELEPRILTELAAVDDLRENAPFTGNYDPAFAERCVLACYGRETAPDAAARACE